MKINNYIIKLDIFKANMKICLINLIIWLLKFFIDILSFEEKTKLMFLIN